MQTITFTNITGDHDDVAGVTLAGFACPIEAGFRASCQREATISISPLVREDKPPAIRVTVIDTTTWQRDYDLGFDEGDDHPTCEPVSDRDWGIGLRIVSKGRVRYALLNPSALDAGSLDDTPNVFLYIGDEPSVDRCAAVNHYDLNVGWVPAALTAS